MSTLMLLLVFLLFNHFLRWCLVIVLPVPLYVCFYQIEAARFAALEEEAARLKKEPADAKRKVSDID